jgi:hypothetical protein
MDQILREESIHLRKNTLNEFICLFVARVHHTCVWLSPDLVSPLHRIQIGIIEASHYVPEVWVKPDCARVPWVVKFRNHSNRISLCYLHDLADNFVGVGLILGPSPVEGDIGECCTELQGEALIIYDVPVEHIKLSEGHRLE